MNNQRSIHQIDGLNNVLIDGFQLVNKIGSTKVEVGNASQRYFLTHFHSDHYKGLKPSWNKGLIYCSTTTAKLLMNVMLVRKEWICGVEINATITIGTNRGNIDVTFIDANHCPGAVLLLFKIDEVTYHLHTGDMRYSPKMKIDPLLARVRGTLQQPLLT
jgi:DNA ligase-1